MEAIDKHAAEKVAAAIRNAKNPGQALDAEHTKRRWLKAADAGALILHPGVQELLENASKGS